MNKLYLVILLLFTAFCKGQNLQVWGNNYASINNYNGIISSNAITVRIDGVGQIYYPTWRVSVRVLSPITNGENQYFPANKVSLLPNAVTGELTPNHIPTITQIGMPLQTYLQEGQEVFLVPQSQVQLRNVNKNTYYNLHLKFNLMVDGGAYLANFTTWSEFQIPLEYKFYDQNNNIVSTAYSNYTLQIGQLSGTPPDPTPQFSISIGSNATNGLVELSSRADYVQGKTVTYPNGLTVNANAAYQLKVKSLQGAFSTNTGNTLPLNTIKLGLSQASSGSGNVFPIWLSTNNQTIANGNSTQGSPVYYDINYSSNPNDVNLISANPGSYSTTLQYEITPQ